MATDGSTQAVFAEVGQDVTSLTRDPFLGVVYVSLRDGSILSLIHI